MFLRLGCLTYVKVNRIARSVFPQVSVALGSVQFFVPVSYKTQVVAGTNYFVKVKTGESEFVHLRIFLPLGTNSQNFMTDKEHTPVLAGIERHTKDSEIKYFAPNA